MMATRMMGRTMNKTRVFGTLAGAALLATSWVTVASAQATQFKQHRDWGAYSYQANGAKNCFVLSKPTSKSPADRDHGDVYFMVAKKADGSGFEPQFRAGYSFAENSDVTVNVDGKAFTMFTQGDGAWLRNKAEEPSLVQAMRAGSKMNVKGQSRRGTATSYDYSLSGVTAALADATACP
jgi:invasion protein IalB